ncbi:TPA: translational GTPase TypA [Patescibacteria group bacterium]|uniref:50S ribosomal subunit assembly factor BipA n=1 Tax=Candidatus Gottesmanbacteria bacterium GW2011_GWA1_43_11 TaxID=1618436 RepID=A0A0G1CGB0_9BACT|nr:MAG: GTP-binding protein TypA [Candidatus Gottesmanbacteria bacterium GW2011_GWA1_43_11]HCS78891.1 translational GTPase TypA [Patescibacteria group bacterium]
MNIRNIAIIAHVDHGKTTLVDALLKQSHTKLHKDTANSLIMDSNELERERGITIFSKNASVVWNETKINIIDTPGHADFGGEVERVLKMADGCLLLIDASEGPMPQTRFVLKKALEMKLKIIVVVNKIDRPDARIDYVLDKTLDLFIDLGADNSQADFPIIYSSGKEGKAGLKPNLSEMSDISPLFETILKIVPPPSGDSNHPLQILITTLAKDTYKGRIAIGRIYNGKVTKTQDIAQIKRDGTMHVCKITALMTFVGLDKIETSESHVGDIVAIAGIPEPMIGETISDAINPVALPVLAIEEPTIRVKFSVNDSPFAGREGEFKTSRQIQARLFKELETDMALRVETETTGWVVSGRGELHIAILIERMRREGYEFQVSRPQVIDKVIDGVTVTPYERLYIEIPESFVGAVMQKVGERKGELTDMRTENGIAYLEFIITTRGLFGYRSEFITDTKGLGVLNTIFEKYAQDNNFTSNKKQGSLIAFEGGTSNGYGLTNVQERGQLFIGPGLEVYKGQVVGIHARENDLRVNVCKTKHLTNMRSKGDGVSVHVDVPKAMGLEDALEYIGDDELVEVTPQNIRIRKMILDEKDAARRRSQGII